MRIDDLRGKTSIRSPRIDRILDAIPPQVSVLDIGCVQHDADRRHRPDWLHQYLYDDDRDVLGIDIDRDGVKALEDAGYTVTHADAESFDLGRTFDVIVAGEILEHLTCPGAMLDRCREHINADGTLIVSTPNPWMLLRVLRAAKGDMDVNPDHTCWFGPSTLRELFTRTGWAIDNLDVAGPVSKGVSNWLYQLGFERLGGPAFVVTATPQVD